MKVLPAYSLYQSKSSKDYKKISSQVNINFCSFSSLLVYAVAREGLATVAKKDSYKYVKELDNCIKSYDIEKFKHAITAISKTPNSFYNDSWSRIGRLAFFKGDIDFIEDLRWVGLKKLHIIPDDSYQNVQIKKDFISSLFENGHPISPTFVSIFKELKDSIYAPFKLDILDIALFSPRYNNKRNNPKNWFNKYKGYTIEKDITTNPKEYDWTWHNLNCKVECLNSSAQGEIGSAYQNLKLFSSLDKEYYQNFILQRKISLNRMKDILEKAIDAAKSTYRGYWESQDAKIFLEDYNKKLKTL